MFGFEVRSGEELLTSSSGLALLGLQLRRSGLARIFDCLEAIGRPERTSGGTIVTSLCGLIALGHLDFDRIEPFRKDAAFARSLGLKRIPSSPTLRQRSESLFGATQGDEVAAEVSACETACAAAETGVRQAMLTMQRGSGLRPTALKLTRGGRMVPVDMDTTVLEEPYGKKEGVGCTYQKVLGYTPMLAYIGSEGYILDGELRPGVQHSQNGTPAAIRRARRMRDGFVAASERLLWRLDGGCDSADTVEAIEECDSDRYIIVHNRRRETEERWLRIARRRGIKSQPRPGKTVWIGEIQRICGHLGRRRCVFRVTKRDTDANGQLFIESKIEIRLFWTNLAEPAEEIISLYADHGTSEQFHAEFKSDLGMEQFPSADYRVNRVLFLLGCLVFNALRQLGQESLRRRGVDPDEQAPIRTHVRRRRLRSVIDDIVRLAGRVIHTGRRYVLSLGCGSPWIAVWLRLHRTFSLRLAT